jgi:NADPH-dependent 2,4-dienoyl-CoA reductase/sulfur reductase-like enzyme
METIIVGGVAAGMSAATRLRRLQEDADITVYEMGENVSYANCGLPYFLSDTISDRNALLLQTPPISSRSIPPRRSGEPHGHRYQQKPEINHREKPSFR